MFMVCFLPNLSGMKNRIIPIPKPKKYKEPMVLYVDGLLQVSSSFENQFSKNNGSSLFILYSKFGLILISEHILFI